jgi:hypothetical protein
LTALAVFCTARIFFLTDVVVASALGAGVALGSAVFWRRRAHRAALATGASRSALALGSGALVGVGVHVGLVYSGVSTILSAATGLTVSVLVAWAVLPSVSVHGPLWTKSRVLGWGLSALAATWVAGLSVLVALGLWPHERTGPRTSVPPTLHELDRSLRLAEGFLDGLNRRLPNGGFVASEHYGVPVEVRLPRGWVHAGEDGTEVRSVLKAPRVERSAMKFRDGPWWISLDVVVYWDNQHVDRLRERLEGRSLDEERRCRRVTGSTPQRGRGAACPLGGRVPGRGVSVYVGAEANLPERFGARLRVAGRELNAASAVSQPMKRLDFDPSERKRFASGRYTIRHATLGAVHKGRARMRARDKDLSGARWHGFSPERDIFAPLWGTGRPVALYRRGVYRDCQIRQPSGRGYYPYRSKICRPPLIAPYIWLTGSDGLLRALQALHVLQLSGNPNERYSTPDHERQTPRIVARKLERQALSFGQPQCWPLGCESRWASAVRSASFGALQAELGYRYHDRVAARWADASARQLLRVQVPADGWLRVRDRSYYRPLQAGGYYSVWDEEWTNAQTFSPITRLVRSQLLNPLEMPTEWSGIISSSAEATLAAFAFLLRYRCLRYGVGCSKRLPPADGGPVPR